MAEGVVANNAKGAGLFGVKAEFVNDHIDVRVGDKHVGLDIGDGIFNSCVFVQQLDVFEKLSDGLWIHDVKRNPVGWCEGIEISNDRRRGSCD